MSKINPVEYLDGHIVTGDAGDNIANVLTPEQWSIDRANGVTPKRQPSMRAERLKEFIRIGRAACTSDFERDNFDRNRELVSFDCIPTEVYDRVIAEYAGYKMAGNKTKVFGYLIKHRLAKLLNEAGSF